MEAIRALNSVTRKYIYGLLVKAGLDVGKRLYDQIAALHSQLDNRLSASYATTTSGNQPQSSAGCSRVTVDR